MVPEVRPRRRGPDLGELALRLAALRVLLLVPRAVLVDLDEQPLGERVHHGDAHAVQAAGDLVAVAAELAAGVQDRQHDLGRALALVRTGGIRVDRNTATVVLDTTAAIGLEGDHDAGAEPRHRLVHRVVDDLPDEVVETRQTGGPDVHSGPFADRIEPFQDLDVFGAVIGTRLLGVASHTHLDQRCGHVRKKGP